MKKSIEAATAISRAELLSIPLFKNPVRHPNEKTEQAFNQARRLAIQIVVLNQFPLIPPEIDGFVFKICKSMIFFRLHVRQIDWIELVSRVHGEIAEAERRQ